MVGLVAMSSLSRAGRILDEVVRQLEFRERLEEHRVWVVWAEVVGKILAARSRPTRIDRGRLFVRVSGAAWMQEFQYLKDEIRRRLNERLGAPVVDDLHFVLGRVVPPKRPEALPNHPVDEDAVARLVPSTGHPEIEAALRRIARARARRLGPTV
jgi:hypothetical protein